MNFKKQAEKLENFLNDEVHKTLPIAEFSDGTVVYKDYKIKKNKKQYWTLRKAGLADTIDVYYLKASAILAAKFYEKTNISKMQEIKRLDSLYQQNYVDSIIFKHRFNTTADIDRRDLSLWRWELSATRAASLKDTIATMFRHAF
jgi:hypothetical protein